MILKPSESDLDLPTSEELPCSDDTPVDNERQNDIPNWLKAILTIIWAEREDWFFGVDMGIYDREGQRRRTPIIPDGFLSLGVVRRKRVGGRLSYVLIEENNIPPVLVLEYISQTYGDEYGSKMQKYAQLGVRYYVLYNPEYYQRDRHDPFEVYALDGGKYVRQPGEPIWMPEVGLGIGRVQGQLEGVEQEWLSWYDQEGNPYPLTFEMIDTLQQQLSEAQRQAEAAQQRAERLADYLRSQGIDPNTVM